MLTFIEGDIKAKMLAKISPKMLKYMDFKYIKDRSIYIG
jgi:hypothetical protein